MVVEDRPSKHKYKTCDHSVGPMLTVILIKFILLVKRFCMWKKLILLKFKF